MLRCLRTPAPYIFRSNWAALLHFPDPRPPRGMNLSRKHS